MEYFVALEWKSFTYHNMDEPQGNYAKRIKPVRKEQILHDSTLMKYPKESKS